MPEVSRSRGYLFLGAGVVLIPARCMYTSGQRRHPAFVEALEARTLLASVMAPFDAWPPAPAESEVVAQRHAVHPSAARASASAIVDIPDPNLLAEIRVALHKPSGAITADEMLSLTSLRAVHRNDSAHAIVDLTGLQYATNLTYLNLEFNAISDLRPLQGLKKLQSLGLYENRIAQVRVLGGLTEMRTLDLGLNRIANIRPLGNLMHLRSLNLNGNHVTDIGPLAQLTVLTKLKLQDNQVRDISALSGMAALAFLNVSGNQIARISPLAGLSKITLLDLHNNNVSDLSPIRGMTNLAVLIARGNQVADISVLSTMARLASVDLRSNLLDLSRGSETMANIAALQARGVQLRYLPQRPAPTAGRQVTVYVMTGRSIVPLQNNQPTALSFGTARRGRAGAERTFKVRNSGRLAVKLGRVDVPAGFAVLQNLPRFLLAGQTANFQVRFVGGAAGPYGGSVQFATGDPRQPTFSIPVTGVVGS